MAGHVPAIGGAIAVGIGSKAEVGTDTSLQFEMDRAEVTLTSYDFVNDKLIFKAPLPAEFAGKIYEVALYSQMENPQAGGYGSRLLTSFDSITETWINPVDGVESVFATSSARIGLDRLLLSTAASSTATSRLQDLFLDLSGNSAADNFVMAYEAGTNVASVSVRFMTDADNYYTITRNAPASGYRFDTFSKGSAVATGNPSWANIGMIQVSVTATAAGSANVYFDGIRVEDTDTINPEYVMVARELLPQPYTKTEGKVQEIEFALAVNIV